MSQTLGDQSDLVIESNESVGDGGFLVLHRYKLRNRRPDGSLSDIYACDYVDRPVGLDAVAVAIFRRPTDGGAVEVLLRAALRPPLTLGRDVKLPVVEPRRSPRLFEVVAGLIEKSDEGLEGVRTRAAHEVHEEAGYEVAPDQLFALGTPTFPMPGAVPEKLYLYAVEVAPDAVAHIPEGDGSPMEEGAEIVWRPIDEAIAACASGELEDMKTEVCLRRLRDALA